MSYYIEKNDFIIVRRHIFLIFFNLLKFIFLLFISIFLYLIWSQISINFIEEHKYIKPIMFTLIFIVFNYSFLKLIFNLIEYYHNLIIVDSGHIVIIKATLIMKSDIESIDSYRIMKIDSFSRGFFSNVFGFGNLVIEQQKDDVRIFHFIPKPYKILSIIKKYKEKAIEERKKYIITKNENK